MVSFINMLSCCMYACFVMHCFVMSASSSQRCLHNTVSAMLCFLPSLKHVNKTCYVYMGAILSSDPFWLMVSKGLLLYALSRFIPCLVLPWYVPVACCFLALNIASWCCFWHVSIFSKSVKLISFEFLPCYFELVLVVSGDSSVFMFCNALPVHHVHVICFHVRMM